MARTAPQPWKTQYARFIDPDYAKVAEVNGWETAKSFQRFQDACFAELPDAGAAKDGYMFSSHAGAFVRSLDEAKDHWIKAKLAFYAVRGSGTVSEPVAVPVAEEKK